MKVTRILFALRAVVDLSGRRIATAVLSAEGNHKTAMIRVLFLIRWI